MSYYFSLTRAIFMGFLFCLLVYSANKIEKSYVPKNRSNPLYLPRVGIVGAACFFLFLPLLIWIYRSELLSYWICCVLSLTVSLTLLLLLCPLFRRFLQAESCATLWSILLIQLIYVNYSPKWVVPLPFPYPSETFATAALWVWLLGFLAVLLWHILSHFIFRYRLLKNAIALDGNIHAIYQKQMQVANFPVGYISIVRSSAANTPVSVGLFWKTTYLVLPDQDYSPEELALIFHHEVVHICRRDSLLKFAMVLIASVFWFYPLVWVALKRCAADLELGCDETVMYGRSPEMRQKYASLLLETADSSPGFTSCLSASAGALRYRLKNILHPKKRIVGGVIVGAVCSALLLLSMHITVRFAPAPAREQIFPGEDLSQMQIMNVTFNDGGTGNYARHTDPAILAYIAELSVSTDELTGSFVHPPDELWVLFELKSPQHIYRIRLWDNYLTVSTFDQDPDTGTFHANDDFTGYHLEAPPDWEYMFSLILPNYLLGQS